MHLTSLPTVCSTMSSILTTRKKHSKKPSLTQFQRWAEGPLPAFVPDSIVIGTCFKRPFPFSFTISCTCWFVYWNSAKTLLHLTILSVHRTIKGNVSAQRIIISIRFLFYTHRHIDGYLRVEQKKQSRYTPKMYLSSFYYSNGEQRQMAKKKLS